MGIKRNRKIVQNELNRYLDINGKTINERTKEFSRSGETSKTVFSESFLAFCTEKNKFSNDVKDFYRSITRNKKKFQAFRRKQKNKSMVINSLQKIYGKSKDVVICIGDWSIKDHWRGSDPIRLKGRQKEIVEAGYEVFLVDEHRTSLMCSICEDEDAKCCKFRRILGPKPNQKRDSIYFKCHGLVRCSTCGRLWNRDVNASINQWKVSYNAIYGRPRPYYLCRQYAQ
jgi:hypothetical protein